MKFYTLLAISIIVLLFSICCKRVIEKYAFNTTSSKNMDYRSTDILDIASGNGKYRNYVPQGFSVTDDYIYFSAYHKFETCDKGVGYDETKPSRVFKVDRSTKKLVKVYTLVDQKIGSHVGGMSVIAETNQFFIASRRKDTDTGKNGICLYNMNGVGSGLDVDVTAHKEYNYSKYVADCPTCSLNKTNENMDLATSQNTYNAKYYEMTLDEYLSSDKYQDTAVTACLGAYAPSYMYWDKSRMLLWYGRFDQNYKGSICANRVTIKSGSAALSNIVVRRKQLPYTKVQGMAVVPAPSLSAIEFVIGKKQNPEDFTDQDGTDAVVYLAVSYGGGNNSKIYKWNLSTGSTSKVGEGWPGLQNLDYDHKTGKMWGITEAGSKYYQNRTKKCGGSGPWGSHPGYVYAEIDV